MESERCESAHTLEKKLSLRPTVPREEHTQPPTGQPLETSVLHRAAGFGIPDLWAQPMALPWTGPASVICCLFFLKRVL